jgi:hypothetical protein
MSTFRHFLYSPASCALVLPWSTSLHPSAYRSACSSSADNGLQSVFGASCLLTEMMMVMMTASSIMHGGEQWILCFCEGPRLITVVIRADHILSYSGQFTACHLISLRFSHLHLGLASYVLILDFEVKAKHANLTSPCSYMSRSYRPPSFIVLTTLSEIPCFVQISCFQCSTFT